MIAEPDDDYGFDEYDHPTWTPSEGDLLGGRYRLLRLAGEGGMGMVWEARDEVLGRTVAVKVLAPELAGDEESRERVRFEARAAAAITHPNIAQVHDYGEANDVPYVVMEFVPGGTLLRRLDQVLPQPRFALRVGAEVAAALAAAHAQGLVHRDVKPANVMLSATGAKVVDFGIAAAIVPAGVSSEEEIFGTAAFLAPERLLDDAVEPASDVYALGLLLHLMLTGRSPWTIEDTTEMLAVRTYFDPPPLPSVPGVPDYVIKLGNRCLQKDPTARPSAREAAALLARAAGRDMPADEPAPLPAAVTAVAPVEVAAPAGAAVDRPELDTLPVSAPPAPDRVRKGRRRLAVIAGAAAALLLTGGVVWMVQRESGRAAAPTALPSAEASVPEASAPAVSAPAPVTTTGTAARTGGTGADANRAAEAGARGGQATPPAGGGEPARPGADAETTEPEPTATAAPVQRTFTSDAGSIRATCPEPSTAEILSWDATKPYKIDDTDAGPSGEPSITFRHGNRRVTMAVSCDGSEPALTSG